VSHRGARWEGQSRHARMLEKSQPNEGPTRYGLDDPGFESRWG